MLGNLKLTPLRVANVPPPMAFSEVELQANAIDVAISRSATLVAVLHHQSISLYKCDFAAKRKALPEFVKSFTVSTTTSRQIAFLGDNQIALLSTEANSEADVIYSIDIGNETVSDPYDAASKVASIFSRADHGRICFETLEGNCFEIDSFDAPTLTLQTQLLARLPVSCPTVEVWSDAEQTIVFAFSGNGTLFAFSKDPDSSTSRERLQVRNCTSFLVTPAHLIFTTTQHLLKFVHLHTGELEIPLDEPEKDERCRSIERGAKLIAVMPTSFSLVMQMPRGNLETIYPRALVLAGIRKSITARDYKTAFLACRNHRVDMNILHDYAPKQFMTSVSLLIKQLKKVEYIDLFLSQLRFVSSSYLVQSALTEIGMTTSLRLCTRRHSTPPSSVFTVTSPKQSKTNKLKMSLRIIQKSTVSVTHSLEP